MGRCRHHQHNYEEYITTILIIPYITSPYSWFVFTVQSSFLIEIWQSKKNLYCREARQMPETIKQEALQLESVLESYGACKFSHTFPMEKPFNYSSLKLLS